MNGASKDGIVQMELGLAPGRRWDDVKRLRQHAALLAFMAEPLAWLVADGVRELLTNAALHGRPPRDVAELVIDGQARTVTLRAPGDEFDSVKAAANPENRWLHRFDEMLREDGATWRWRREQDVNVLEIRLDASPHAQGGGP